MVGKCEGPGGGGESSSFPQGPPGQQHQQGVYQRSGGRPQVSTGQHVGYQGRQGGQPPVRGVYWRENGGGGSSSFPQRPPGQQQQQGVYQRRGSRPQGSTGQRCIVKANHFLAELTNKKDIRQYNVTINPKMKSLGVNRAVMDQLVTRYWRTDLGNMFPAYDGRTSLYTAGPLPFNSKEFNITLLDGNDGSGGTRRERRFKVVIKLASTVDFCEETWHGQIDILDIVLRQLSNINFTPVGQSFYYPVLGPGHPLGEGLEAWHGFYQSLRLTQMGPSLNIGLQPHSSSHCL